MLLNRQTELLELCDYYEVWLQSQKTGHHYLLSSRENGMMWHTRELFEFACGFQHLAFREIVAREIMAVLKELNVVEKIGAIVTPAMGGVLLGATLQEAFRFMRVVPRLLYTERFRRGMMFRRNFVLNPNEAILQFDDVTRTGRSFTELDRVCMGGGPVLAKIAILNRGLNPHPPAIQTLVIPQVSLVHYPVEVVPAELCTDCKHGMPLYKDGVQRHQLTGEPIEA